MTFDDLSRQRIDYSTGPNGETIATLTVTFQDGSVHRFEASVDDDEVNAFAAALGAAELKAARIAGDCDDDEIAGMFDFVTKAAKSIANIAKKVVTSKVFKTAAGGLAAVAPALGPLAPIALGVSGAMAVTSKLTEAATANEGGAKRTSRKLTKLAAREAAKHARSPKARKALMVVANRKRKAAGRLASHGSFLRSGLSMRRVSVSSPRRKKKKGLGLRYRKAPSVFAAAKRGKLRSLKRGSVSTRGLKKAMKAGRVFWIAA